MFVYLNKSAGLLIEKVTKPNPGPQKLRENFLLQS